MPYLYFVSGLILLFVGGESLVSGAVRFARVLGLSPLVIGLTLVAFGTSVPELVASLEAALRGSPGIAVGNVVGSNITNILLIIGLVAAISPVACVPGLMRRDGVIMVVTAFVCLAALIADALTVWTGALFVAGLVAYVLHAFRAGAHAGAGLTDDVLSLPGGIGATKPLLLAITGLVLVLAGASLLVEGAIEIATELGIRESTIGLTIVALGTSLPELVTSMIAAFKRQAEIAVGNIIGSNIFNVLGILGITSLVSPLPVADEIRAFDGYVMCAVTLLFMAASISGRRISRGEGALFLGLYAAYIAFLSTRPN